MRIETSAATLVPLTRRGDFVRAAKRGESAPTPAFILQVMPYPSDAPGVYRVGFTASRKFSKRAVDRNRAKRRLRALAQQDLPAQAGPERAYIFIARRAILDRPFAELRRDLRRALRRLAPTDTLPPETLAADTLPPGTTPATPAPGAAEVAP